MATFNTNLLAACIAISVASVLYVFFWNRLIGALLGLFLRLLSWNRAEYSIWVDFGSVHISLLAGRILFKDFRYHSSNQSIRLVKCQLSWRYWIRNVAEEEDLDASKSPARFSPHCRIHMSVEGLEWFLYNRTAAFEDILYRMNNEAASKAHLPDLVSRDDSAAGPMRSSYEDSKTVREVPSVSTYPKYQPVLSTLFYIPVLVKLRIARIRKHLPHLHPRNLLPVSFDCTKAAVTLGNHASDSLIQAQFTEAQGTFGLVKSRSPLDHYKQNLRIKFMNATIDCIVNKDFWDTPHSIGRDVQDHVEQALSSSMHDSSWLFYRRFDRLWRRYFSSKKYTRMYAQRVADRSKNKDFRYDAIFPPPQLEYAINRKLLETPILELRYYADIAGTVPDSVSGSYVSDVGSGEGLDVGNGDLPPEWGVDFVVNGGTIRYGPWADRQRGILQRIFFPATYQRASPTARLQPGDERLHTSLRMFVELRHGTVLHIPFREASKDWQWDGQMQIHRLLDEREAASLQIRAGDRSTVKYIVPMVANEEGYEATMSVHLDDVSITTSLNDIRILTADGCHIAASLPSHLDWSEERHWKFDVSFDNSTLYLLRDHVNMLTDLGKDWSSGPPSDFHSWVPMTYSVAMCFKHYEINLYGNDHNIIDRPLVRDENTLFSLHGSTLSAEVVFPSNIYRPESTAVPFTIDAPDVGIRLTLPRWNTHALHSVSVLDEVGRVKNLEMDGSFLYFAEVHEDYIERLKLDVKFDAPTLKLFGWVVRHLMVLRENYFGDFTHYSTTHEYLEKKDKNIPVGDPLDLKHRAGKTNKFEVNLGVVFENGLVVIPAGLPGFESATEDAAVIGASSIIKVPELQIYLRLHEYFMELSANSDPFVIAIVKDCPNDIISSKPPELICKDLVYIDGLDITSNRLFGPQPHATAYVCMWEIKLGSIRCTTNAEEGKILLYAGRAFVHGYTDAFNAPAEQFAIPEAPDATYLKVVLDSLDILWLAQLGAVRLSLPDGIGLDSNNLAGSFYKGLTSMRAPFIGVQCLRQMSAGSRWLEAASFRSDLYLDLYKCPEGWKEDVEEQRRFLFQQDAETHRVPELYDSTIPSTGGYFKHSLYLPPAHAPQYILNADKGLARVSEPSEAEHHDDVLEEDDYWRRTNIEVSESDGEQGVSEFDRDERLANSRPKNMGTPSQHAHEEHFSSGDESDEASSSVSRTSWSDMSEHEEDDNDVQPRTRLGLYANICRQFSIAHHSAYERESATYIIDNRPLPMHGPRHPPSANPNRNFGILVDDVPALLGEYYGQKDFAGSILRLNSLNGFDVFLTPVFTSAAIPLIEDAYYDHMSPELRVDALISKLAEPKPPSSSSLIIDASSSSLKLTIAQDFMSVAETHAFMSSSSQPPSKSDRASRTRFVSVAEVAVVGCNSIVVIPTGSSSAASEEQIERARGCVKMEQLSFKLGTMLSSTIASGPSLFRSPLPVFEVDINMFTATHSAGKTNITLDSFNMALHRSAPESILITTRLTAEALDNFQALRKKLADQSQLQLHRLLRVILNSRRENTADRLSTVQPSFLVQEGRPHQMRQNRDWKFLFSLRTSLRQIPPMIKNELESQTIIDAVPISEMYDLFERESVGWFVDGDQVKASDIPLVRSLYQSPEGTKSSNTSSFHWLQSASFSGKSFRIKYEDVSQSSVNEVNLGAVYIRADFTERYLIANPGEPSIGRHPTNLMSTVITLDLDSINIGIYPSLIPFLEHILHVQKVADSSFHSVEGSKKQVQPKGQVKPPFIYELHLSLRQLCIQIAADRIFFETSLSGLSSTSMLLWTKLLPMSDLDVSLSHVTCFEEVSLKVKERFLQTQQKADSLLASIVFSRGVLNGLRQVDASSGLQIRAILGIEDVQLSVPRSAIRLYYFYEKWREEYLLGTDVMMQSLFKEMQRSQDSTRVAHDNPLSTTIQVQMSSPNMKVSLQVMHGTWLSWQISDVLFFLRSSTTSGGHPAYQFGGHVAAQQIAISSVPVNYRYPRIISSASAVELELPSIRVTGSHDSMRLDVLALVDFLHISIKPTHWDALLTVQQKFGSDFTDLLTLISQNRRKAKQPLLPEKQSLPTPYGVTIKFRGFRIGLEAAPSTLFLQCDDIDGSMTSIPERQWHIKLFDLALSLSPKAYLYQPLGRSGFNRQKCSAFVILDLLANNHPEPGQGTTADSKYLGIAVTKLHAVMHPSSIGEIGDFVDHLQAEMLLRKEERANDLRDFKEKAKSVTRTFNENPHTNASQSTFFTDRSIRVKMTSFGAAFPLSLDQKLELPRDGYEGTSPVQAFLFSIKDISFHSHRGQTGQARMNGFSFQFIQEFRQFIPSDYSGEAHETTNRLVYPEMTAYVRLETGQSSRQIRVGADISGFVFDVDPSITSYVFSVIDVYNHGRDRMERLTAGLPRGNSDTPLRLVVDLPVEAQFAAVPTSNVQASLQFRSGTVRIHSPKTKTGDSHTAAHRFTSGRQSKLSPEIFALPEAAVWCEFKATPAAQKLASIRGRENTYLLFRSTVYSSQNTLRPSLLPFFTEVVRNIEGRLRRIPSSRPNTLAAPQSPGVSSDDKYSISNSGALSTLHITFGLRIDKSTLELTCQPDVNVLAGLYWESGGFVVNITPGAKRVSIAGSVDGLTMSLKHGYLSEHCAQFDARNLTFSVAFSKADAGMGRIVNVISAVVDTELSGSLRFTRLQDLLCFQAVWLDRIPVLGGDSISSGSGTKQNSSALDTSRQAITTSLFFRARRIELQIDLGQSISHISLFLDSFHFRTNLAAEADELSFFVEKVELLGTGNISGHMRTSNSHFNTVRRRPGSHHQQDGEKRMLQLTLTSGALDVLLLADGQWLLQYRAEPLDATVFDDWAFLQSSIPANPEGLNLSFVVRGTTIVAHMTLSTIPKLVTYGGKFRENLEAQRDGASRESQVFRSSRTAKPDNTLTEVAQVMLQSARTKFKESSNVTYAIGQRMSLHLEELVFVLFPRTSTDIQLARFRAVNVSAQLDRHVNADAIHRYLVLSLAHMAVAQLNRNALSAIVKPKEFDVAALLESQSPGMHESVIFSLPAMDMRMASDEIGMISGDNELSYEFDSTFTRSEGRQALENISITFNLSLYSWLTDLRKTLIRDLKRAQETAEWRPGDTLASPVGAHARRKTLESGISVVPPAVQTADSLPNVPPSVPGESNTSPQLPPSESITGPAPQTNSKQLPHLSMVSSPSAPQLSVEIPTKSKPSDLVYKSRRRHIERLTVRQLGEATPDLMHPFFTKKAGFNLETAFPQYVHEYATQPVEQIMKALVKIYSKQLRTSNDNLRSVAETDNSHVDTTSYSVR